MLYLLMSVDSVAQIIQNHQAWGGVVLLAASLAMTTLSVIGYRRPGSRSRRTNRTTITVHAPSADAWAAEMEQRLRSETTTITNERRRTW
ncbi:hypothetical protein GCM10009563_33590 [Subtercola frigoramans]